MQRYRQLRRLTSHEREFKHHSGWSDNAGYLYNGRHVRATTAGTQRYAADANNSQVCFAFSNTNSDDNVNDDVAEGLCAYLFILGTIRSRYKRTLRTTCFNKKQPICFLLCLIVK